MYELPKNCADVRGSLPLYVGRDLEPAEIEAVQGHLNDCADCRGELEAAESARRALLSLHVASEPPTAPTAVADEPELDLWPGIHQELVRAGLVAGAEPVAAAPGFALLKGGRPHWVAAAAAAFLLAWFGFFAKDAGPQNPGFTPSNGGGAPLVDANDSAPHLVQPAVAQPAGAGVMPVSLTNMPAGPGALARGGEAIDPNCSGGLRRIDPSEALVRRAQIFTPDAPAFHPVDVRMSENPNRAVGLQ